MTNKQKKTEVITVFDRHDEQYLLQTLRDMGANGGAHLHMIEDFDDVFVVSSRPMSPRSAQRAFHADQAEMAREALKEGASPEDVWNMYRVSAATIGRICKEEGIKTPYRWFATAWKNSEAANQQKTM